MKPATESDAARLDRLRSEVEARLQQVIVITGTQHFKAWVAGVELGVLMRWVKRHG